VSFPLRFILGLKGMFLSRRFERQARNPERSQREVLQRILKTQAGTAFGREHGFASIRTPEDFARQVPVRDYEGHRPWVERQVQGESGVLTVEDPFMYATTSGTTDKPKLIPVTPSWRKQITSLMSLWVARAQRDHPGMLRHRILSVVSPAVEGRTPLGLPVGAVSGFTQQRMPWLIRRAYCLPYAVTTISNYDTRYLVAMRLALGSRVSMVITPNPSTLLRLAEVGSEAAQSIIRAIHDGVLGVQLGFQGSPEGAEQAAVGAQLAAGLSPDPARARFLEGLVERHGTLRPRDAWPDLALIGCWLGGSAGIQSTGLSAWYGETALRDIGFRATESTMTVPLVDGTAAGPLSVGAGYYEFVPEDAIDSAAPTTLGAHELQVGHRYYILLTTCGGLYRYDINDIVEVQGNWGGCPTIAFVRKGRDMANITGEKLHANQVLMAAQRAGEATGFPWTQVQVIPDVEGARYDLLVESSEAGLPVQQLQVFALAMDAELARCNEEYEQKRKSRRLHLLRVHQMKVGWFHRRHRRDVTLGGKRDSQYKWPLVQLEWSEEDRKEIDRVLEAEVADDLTGPLNLLFDAGQLPS